jgi:hypothetical protein
MTTLLSVPFPQDFSDQNIRIFTIFILGIGRYYGIKMNVENTKLMRISSISLPVQIMIDTKTT